MRKLKIVFFDIDDTLYSTSEFSRVARQNALHAMIRLGLRARFEDLSKELAEIIEEFSSNYDHHFDKLLVRLSPDAHLGVNPAVLVAGAVIAYHRTKQDQLRPFPEVPSCLRRLARSRLRLGVITSGWDVKQAEKLLRLDLYRYFDPSAVFVSEQIGISKPNAKLYQRCCERSGVKPEEAAYVGDHPRNDVDPPNELGMITFWCRRGGRHQNEPLHSCPTYTINNLRKLLAILHRDFGVRC